MLDAPNVERHTGCWMNLRATLKQHQADDRCCHVLEEVASCRRDTLDFVLSVRTLEAQYRQHNTLVFLSRRRAAKIFTFFSTTEIGTDLN